MPNKKSFIPLTADKAHEVRALLPLDLTQPAFRVVSQEQIPTVFPKSFRKKFDNAVVMGSGDPNGRTYLVVNAHRVDEAASAIDQEPFGVVFDNGNPSESGVFIHHGSWAGRTERNLPEEFWQRIAESGIGNYYPPPSLPEGAAGSLSDLSTSSNLGAFNQALKAMTDL